MSDENPEESMQEESAFDPQIELLERVHLLLDLIQVKRMSPSFPEVGVVGQSPHAVKNGKDRGNDDDYDLEDSYASEELCTRVAQVLFGKLIEDDRVDDYTQHKQKQLDVVE